MKSLHDQIANKCKHFNGIMEKTCRAGIPYDRYRDEEGKLMGLLPCFKDEALASLCSLAAFPTEEEVQARIQEIDDSFNKVSKAREACVAYAKAQGWGKGKQSGCGRIVCPVCGGILSFSIASVNGHIHAACSNPNCIRWME